MTICAFSVAANEDQGKDHFGIALPVGGVFNVVSQGVVYIEAGRSFIEGYGEDAKLNIAFNFPSTPQRLRA
jgi:hypothetical protein